MNEATARAEAKRLHALARGHKRTATRARREGREATQALAALVNQCREAGIDLVIETIPTQPRRQSGNSSSRL